MMFQTELLESQRTRALRWATAAMVVFFAHVGCASLALVHWQDDGGDIASASSIVLEMVPAAVPIDSPDVAHGPLMEEAVLTPEAAKEIKETTKQEAPSVEPSPAPEPEVVLPVQKLEPEKKPEEEEPEEKPQPRRSEQVVAAPLTMAPPRVEAKEQSPTTATSLAATAATARAQATWEKSLVAHLNRFKRYPAAARTGGHQGDVGVEFTIDRAGVIAASRIVRSSGTQALDEEALAVLQRASPLPAPPSQVNGAALRLSLPIQFRIK